MNLKLYKSGAVFLLPVVLVVVNRAVLRNRRHPFWLEQAPSVYSIYSTLTKLDQLYVEIKSKILLNILTCFNYLKLLYFDLLYVCGKFTCLIN